MQVRIYQPPKSAMQSGRANTRRWLLEYEPETAKSLDPVMGWTASLDTNEQLRMWFGSKEEAVDYATRKGLMYSVESSQERRVRPKSYGENFAYDRVGRWTH